MRDYISDITKKVSLKIKLERVKRGWSQEQLAEHANLNANTIGKIERAQISPTIDTIVQIAEAFDMDFSKLTNIVDI